MEEYGSFLDFNLDEVPEPVTVKGGREYQLKIASAEIKESGGEKTAGQNYLNIRSTIVDEPEAQPVYDVIMLPSKEADEEQNLMRKRNMKRLVTALGWDLSQGFSIDDLPGQLFWAVLGEEEYQGQERNVIKTYMSPQAAEKAEEE